MRELETGINEVKQSNMNTEIPVEILHSLNEIIQKSASLAVVKVMRQQVRELSQMIQNDKFITNSLRVLVMYLQEKFDTATPQGVIFSTLPSGDPSPQTSELRPPQNNPSSQEQEDVKKGTKRLEIQILQFIRVFIPCDQTNIALLKKCKTMDVPAVNSAIDNLKKALQKCVGFSKMDADFCDGIEDLMDRAQAWCLDVKELY